MPALRLIDGPNGARGTDGNHGPTSLSLPVGVAMGATWDPGLIEAVGSVLGRETISKGGHVLLGPTVNIPRIPTAGRNFECFSEDPLLSGLLAAAWIRGVQGEGVAACIKHFACNDQETNRYEVDAVVDERSLREVYLEPFRIAVERAGPWAAMSAYNTLNGVTASEHPLLDDVLRGEFGFDGAIVSDWYGTYSAAVTSSGLDLEMPGPARWLSAERVRAAIARGDATWADVDRKVGHLLTLVDRSGARRRTDLSASAVESPAHRGLARRVATEAITLLTNDGSLPLGRPSRIAVIGELAADTPHQGGGSSSVNPHRVVSVLDGIRAAVGPDAEVTWSHGTRVRKSPPPFPPGALGDGLLVEYFPGSDLTGEPVRSIHTTRSFINLFGEVDGPLELDRCAIRVSGTFTPRASGSHRFRFAAEGRLRVELDGATVWDSGDAPAADGFEVEYDLTAGTPVGLRLEYSSRPGLRWRFVGWGCEEPGPEPSVDAAARAAADADVAVVVAGLTPEWESEGFDRPDLVLPGDQDALIASVAAAQPRTIVVLTGGSPLLMPWRDDVAAILHAWYGGQEVGHAVADVLWGRAEPGGRLPVTFPATSDQHPALPDPSEDESRVPYREGTFVGYRGFDRLGLEPLFPIGHGLSYAAFAASPASDPLDRDAPSVRVDITNVGLRRGSDVVRVFARDVGGVDRSLVGFAKVRLDPGETTTCAVPIDPDRLRRWSRGAWEPVGGPVRLTVEGLFEPFDVIGAVRH